MGQHKSKLSSEDAAMLQKQTYFTRKELNQWYKGFLKDCPSGQLTKVRYLHLPPLAADCSY